MTNDQIKSGGELHLRDAKEIPAAIEEWFFRDVGETQRRQLINWCGHPGVEANGEEFQRQALRSIIAALSRTPSHGRVSEPSVDNIAAIIRIMLHLASEREREAGQRAAEAIAAEFLSARGVDEERLTKAEKALREVALEAHETIPPDGKEAAFMTLHAIGKIVSSYFSTIEEPRG